MSNLTQISSRSVNYQDQIDWATALVTSQGVAAGVADAFFGFLPLNNIQKLSLSWSNRAVKYRATSNFFFAYQKGEYEGKAVAVTCIFAGPLKWLALNTLRSLYIYQRGRAVDIVKHRKKTRHIFSANGQTFRTMFSSPGNTMTESMLFNGLTFLGRRLGSNQLAQLRNSGNTIASREGERINITHESQDDTITSPEYRNIIYHRTFPFVSKAEVLLHAYLESVTVDHEASTNDMITVNLMIREYIKPGDYIEHIMKYDKSEGVRGIKGRLFQADKWAAYLMLNSMMAGVSTAFEYTRHAVLRRNDITDVVPTFDFWGSEPLEPNVISQSPKIDIYDPEGNDGDPAIDVDDWYYFDFSKLEFPIEVYIDTRPYGGSHKYAMLFYINDEIPRNHFGFYERTTTVTCVVKDEEGNVTDRFVISEGLIYRIGDKTVRICFDQLELRYDLSTDNKFGHTLTGRWYYSA